MGGWPSDLLDAGRVVSSSRVADLALTLLPFLVIPLTQDMSDPMTDIPLDLSPYYLQWRQQKRRADGSRISERDLPEAWNLTPEQRAQMDKPWLDLQSQIQTSYDSNLAAGGNGLGLADAEAAQADSNAAVRDGRESGIVTEGSFEEWENSSRRVQ